MNIQLHRTYLFSAVQTDEILLQQHAHSPVLAFGTVVYTAPILLLCIIYLVSVNYNNIYICNIIYIWYVYTTGKINVFEQVGDLMPIRKKGRPTKRAKALERVDDLDVMALRPGDWRKTPVRHPEYLNGWVVDYRTKPDTKRTVVWQV